MTAGPSSPDRIGPYDIERVLGRGSMGMVYLARDTRIGRLVAIKKVHFRDRGGSDDTAAAEFYKRLQREAEVCGALQHRNLVTLYEAGYEGDRISYLVMEYVDGETLQAMIKRARPSPLPVDVAISVAADTLRGLAYAHAKGIVHRDIKPANILVNGDGVAKIADFGIARPETSSMTVAGAVMGTPNYMSPEQVMAKTVSPKADVFSVGVILFETLTGARPFMAETIDLILKRIVSWQQARLSEMNPEVPENVSELVARMLAKDPADRPTAMEALEILRPNETQAETDPAAYASTQRSLLRKPVAPRLFALIVAAAIAAVIIPVLAMQSAAHRPPQTHFTSEQLKEFSDKRHLLDEAKVLLDNGRPAESYAKYDDYLKKYPHSMAAQEGREKARLAMEEEKKSEERKSGTKRKRREQTPLDRLRKIFRG